jgi:serine/threonine-protein kinase RsbW
VPAVGRGGARPVGGVHVTEESTRSAASQVSDARNSLNNAFSIQSSGRTYGARNPAAPSGRPARPGATAPADPADRDEVTVRMPADGVYLSVLRTATAGLAARLDFTLDEIEDMRIAVDEACAMLLSQAIPGSNLECRFSLGQDAMTIFVSVRCVQPRVPAGDTFAWTVLTALAGSVDAEVGPGDRLTLVLRKSRDTSRSV